MSDDWYAPNQQAVGIDIATELAPEPPEPEPQRMSDPQPQPEPQPDEPKAAKGK